MTKNNSSRDVIIHLSRTVRYCQKDIITTVCLLQKFRGEEPFPADVETVLLRRT